MPANTPDAAVCIYAGPHPIGGVGRREQRNNDKHRPDNDSEAPHGWMIAHLSSEPLIASMRPATRLRRPEIQPSFRPARAERPAFALLHHRPHALDLRTANDTDALAPKTLGRPGPLSRTP